MKTRRYVGKGLRAWFFSRQSNFWCSNIAIREAIDSYVEQLFQDNYDSNVKTVHTAMQAILGIAGGNKVFGQAVIAGANMRVEANTITIPNPDLPNNPLTINLFEDALANDVMRFKVMVFWMFNIKTAINNIITKVRNLKSFRTTNKRCKVDQGQPQLLTTDVSKLVILDAVITSIKKIRRFTDSGDDATRIQPDEKYYFTNDFTYAQLKRFILSEHTNPVHPINSTLLGRIEAQLEAQPNPDPEQLADLSASQLALEH